MLASRPQQKRWVILLKILGGITLAIWLSFIYATIHYDNISPTVADESSGHVYPSYDKMHGRYVYLDQTAKNSELEIAVVAVAFFFCTVLVILKVKRLSSPSLGTGSDSM